MRFTYMPRFRPTLCIGTVTSMQERFTSKSLNVLREPRERTSGVGEFRFIDHYSIFHLGKMPDTIPAKGEAACRMAVANLQALEASGVPTHFLRASGPDRMEFRLLRIIDPVRTPIREGERAYFIPLQVIFRKSLPAGSSVFRRLAAGEIDLGRLGLNRAPEPGQQLPVPFIEYMTKLDEIDDFIPRETARRLAGLTPTQLDHLEEILRQVCDVLFAKARSVGLQLADGKLEFGVDDRGDILLVDIAGTPDESRYLLADQHISKQILRDVYVGTGLREQVRQWASQGRPSAQRPSPPPLGTLRIGLISDMYKSLCERWLGTVIWGAPALETIVSRLRQLPSFNVDNPM